ncbi:hypothetical protein CYMTET_24537 [Cymbomonas tetramitiformis]|uniref:Tyr recombinase domain-containing protein n=1 Tax=Cymbomonas tetramitiformis TaxID=36881 RepID=A0AAE0FVM8_9CHLO|nr:hypothetical protein CYMTET_24537 [Cymbomonas tetramitiformis]
MGQFLDLESWFLQPTTRSRAIWQAVTPSDAANSGGPGQDGQADSAAGPQAGGAVGILVGFSGLFREDNLTAGETGAWNTCAALVRDDILFKDRGEEVWNRVGRPETIQCGRSGDSWSARPGRRGIRRVSSWRRRVATVPMTHGALVADIKSLAERVGLDPGSYAEHSLRRGGATAAMRLDVNNMCIKMQGDWKSDCFERYCELDQEQKLVPP